jgi:hypothetical protein
MLSMAKPEEPVPSHPVAESVQVPVLLVPKSCSVAAISDTVSDG